MSQLSSDDRVARALAAADRGLWHGKWAVRRLSRTQLTDLVEQVDRALVELHRDEIYAATFAILPYESLDTFIWVKGLAILRGRDYCASLVADATQIQQLGIEDENRLLLGEDFLLWLRDYYTRRTGVEWELPDDAGIHDLNPINEDEPIDLGCSVFVSFDRAMKRLPWGGSEMLKNHIEVMPEGSYVRLERADRTMISQVAFMSNRVYSLVGPESTGEPRYTLSAARAAEMLDRLARGALEQGAGRSHDGTEV